MSTVPACSPSFKPNSQACGSSNGSHNTDRNVPRLEDWTLLDMQFEKRFVVTSGQKHIIQLSGKSGCDSDLIQRLYIAVCKGFGSSGIQAPRQQTAAQTSNAETSRLLRREHQKFDRAPWLKAGALKRANRFQTTEDTDRAIVRSCMGNRIGV